MLEEQDHVQESMTAEQDLAVEGLSSTDDFDDDSEADGAVKQKADADAAEDDKGKKHEIFVSLPMTVSCRADLDEILDNHKDWLESVLNPAKRIGGGRANLKNADLSGFDLTGVNLSGATLEHTKLIGANLTKANLTAANLTHADLQGAKLIGTKLKRAILDYADFRDADMVDVDLTKAHLNHTQLPKPARVDEEASHVELSSDEAELAVESNQADSADLLLNDEGREAAQEPLSEDEDPALH